MTPGGPSWTCSLIEIAGAISRKIILRAKCTNLHAIAAAPRPAYNLTFVTSFADDITAPVMSRICSPALVN